MLSILATDAAAAGTVLIARYSSSAGYWVVIDHGNGLTTKYMHMFEMPYVREGQKVVKGQHIGGVGTTGQSTGNHLHFQVSLNGNVIDGLSLVDFTNTLSTNNSNLDLNYPINGGNTILPNPYG